MTAFLATAGSVGIRRPVVADREEFLSRALASQAFLEPWIHVPTGERFDRYLATPSNEFDIGFLLFNLATNDLMGVINVNCIVRGYFQSAYLGYYMFCPFGGQGFMTQGLRLVIGYAFGEMKLHRLEANIQPENAASIALVKKCGFHKEGYSPRYLQVMGAWRDHERWALLADDPAAGGSI